MGDICFVASTADGMNLVSHEYVACHNAKAMQVSKNAIAPGVLVLSQFTGAAKILQSAVVVNPYDAEGCAAVLAHALNMHAGEAKLRMEALGKIVDEYTRQVDASPPRC
jgi:trehalose 6-phosphate synthase